MLKQFLTDQYHKLKFHRLERQVNMFSGHRLAGHIQQWPYVNSVGYNSWITFYVITEDGYEFSTSYVEDEYVTEVANDYLNWLSDKWNL